MHATITSKGQITLPQRIREHLNLHSGDRVEFIENENGTYSVYPVTSSITALKGMTPAPSKEVTLEEMEKAIVTSANS